jgi:hypothetical protein
MQNLLFSDESRFCKGPDNRWIWRRQGEYEETIFAPADKYAKISIHLWGAVGIGFKSSLVFFEKTVDSDVYVNSLITSGFVAMADATFGPCQWFLVQDGASCHTSARALNSLFEICNVFPVWPPNSPDLNPIECLWGAIKRRLRWQEIGTAAQAIEVIQRVWDEFDQASIDRLVASFANRVDMVREAEGRTIQPLISAGKIQVPLGYAIFDFSAKQPSFEPLIIMMSISHRRLCSQRKISYSRESIASVEFSIKFHEDQMNLNLKIKIKIKIKIKSRESVLELNHSEEMEQKHNLSKTLLIFLKSILQFIYQRMMHEIVWCESVDDVGIVDF